MISRRTTLKIADAFEDGFSYNGRGFSSGRTTHTNYLHRLYDFLYEHEYDAWLCNKVRALYPSVSRQIKDLIMKLHTGETQVPATSNWTWPQRERLGQSVLLALAEDLLTDGKGEVKEQQLKDLTASLELDGYTFRSGKVVFSEAGVLDVEEVTGVLRTLFRELALSNENVAFHHLTLSEEHYFAQKWEDCIANSRKFLECILSQGAVKLAQSGGNSIAAEELSRPVRVREYLEREGLLERKERETLSQVYGLLSETGSHPYIAEKDQARLLRHLALTFSEFVLLRLRGRISASTSK